MSRPEVPKTIYTILPEHGGAYGWIIRDGDETHGVGPNHADTTGWDGDHPISDELHRDFREWQIRFEREVAPWRQGHPLFDLSFDWTWFHARGLELCRRLKQELGDAVRIVYIKPSEDPDFKVDQRREILLDGSLRSLPTVRQLCCVPISRQVMRIVSGGQTGADRAVLDWAIRHGISHGGWCPTGRLAEDGVIDARYRLQELPSGGYRQRTRKNVEDSDGTLILNLGELDGGSLETQTFARQLNKLCLTLQLDEGWDGEDRQRVILWLRGYEIRCLNIAGPRESKRPGIYAAVTALLDDLDQSGQKMESSRSGISGAEITPESRQEKLQNPE